MNKKLFILASLLIVLQAGWSKPIDQQKAESTAHSFLNYSTVSSNSSMKSISPQLKLVYACTGKTQNPLCSYRHGTSYAYNKDTWIGEPELIFFPPDNKNYFGLL